jgi:hypothetical protein
MPPKPTGNLKRLLSMNMEQDIELHIAIYYLSLLLLCIGPSNPYILLSIICLCVCYEPYDEALGEGYRASPKKRDECDPKSVWVHAW